MRALALPGGASLARARTRRADRVRQGVGRQGARVLAQGVDGERALADRQVLRPRPSSTALRERDGAEPGDLILIVADEPRPSWQRVLGALRPHLAQRAQALRPEVACTFAWVVDFPLFAWDAERAAGSPSTTRSRRRGRRARGAPRDRSRRGASQAYDLVINGDEAGGGTIRIHRPDVQQRVLRLLGIDRRGGRGALRLPARALRYGAPPHGGIALGLDRCSCSWPAPTTSAT